MLVCCGGPGLPRIEHATKCLRISCLRYPTFSLGLDERKTSGFSVLSKSRKKQRSVSASKVCELRILNAICPQHGNQSLSH